MNKTIQETRFSELQKHSSYYNSTISDDYVVVHFDKNVTSEQLELILEDYDLSTETVEIETTVYGWGVVGNTVITLFIPIDEL